MNQLTLDGLWKRMDIVVRDDSLVMELGMHVGIAGIGVYLPDTYMTAADLAAATFLSEEVVALKFGIKRKPVAGSDNTTAEMGYKAAVIALEEAKIEAGMIDW
jgi:3-oxoacyl-[acyl-carrier-protein] synthase-3